MKYLITGNGANIYVNDTCTTIEELQEIFKNQLYIDCIDCDNEKISYKKVFKYCKNLTVNKLKLRGTYNISRLIKKFKSINILFAPYIPISFKGISHTYSDDDYMIYIEEVRFDIRRQDIIDSIQQSKPTTKINISGISLANRVMTTLQSHTQFESIYIEPAIFSNYSNELFSELIDKLLLSSFKHITIYAHTFNWSEITKLLNKPGIITLKINYSGQIHYDTNYNSPENNFTILKFKVIDLHDDSITHTLPDDILERNLQYLYESRFKKVKPILNS